MANKITVYRGTSKDIVYNHVNSEGAALDITGSTVYFTVKADIEDNDQADATAVIKKTVTSHTNPTGGVTGWSLSDADTYIESGKYYFSIVVENAAGKSGEPSVYGEFNVKGHPTNRQTLNG